jgi:hypothetical protein
LRVNISAFYRNAPAPAHDSRKERQQWEHVQTALAALGQSTGSGQRGLNGRDQRVEPLLKGVTALRPNRAAATTLRGCYTVVTSTPHQPVQMGVPRRSAKGFCANHSHTTRLT